MPRFRIHVELEQYLNYVAECANETEAQERGRQDFWEGVIPQLSGHDLFVEVEQVPDDTPEGDC